MAKGHVPYAMMMLLDVLRAFPGQVVASAFACSYQSCQLCRPTAPLCRPAVDIY